MRYLSREELVALVGNDKNEGELLVVALRRKILSGKVIEADFAKLKNFGKKSYNGLLEFLELKKSAQVIEPV